MIGVKKCISISHLPTFGVENIWSVLKTVLPNSELIAPDYKTYIPAASLRRFSPILRFSYAAAMALQKESDIQFDGIIVGTGLGCLKDTEKFLQTVINSKGESLSPTAFIQSTHNTIGGALSIALTNHAYNMTHTQEYFSFEWALIDAMMKIEEGSENILVGAADEYIDFLSKLQPKLIANDFPLTSGTTFAHLSNESDVVLKAIMLSSGNLKTDLIAFLNKNGCSEEDIDIQLIAKECKELPTGFLYTLYTGNHQAHSAFAFHLAVDAIRHEKKKKIVIINNHHADKRSFMLLQGNE